MLARTLPFLAAVAVALTAISAVSSQADTTPTSTPYPSGDCFRPLKGDFDNDRVITMADTIGFLKNLAGIPTSGGITCGMNINCDFELDSLDLLAMLGYHAGLDYFHPVRLYCAAIGNHQGPVLDETFTPEAS